MKVKIGDNSDFAPNVSLQNACDVFVCIKKPAITIPPKVDQTF